MIFLRLQLLLLDRLQSYSAIRSYYNRCLISPIPPSPPKNGHRSCFFAFSNPKKCYMNNLLSIYKSRSYALPLNIRDKMMSESSEKIVQEIGIKILDFPIIS